MAKKVIGLDSGHGLGTAGKETPTGIKEWTLNDKVRDKVVALLSDYDVSFVFPDNNEGKVDESLTSRRTMYVSQGVDAFVSIHHNAFSGNWNNATGVEVFTDKGPTTADLRLADCIYGRLVKYSGLKGRGIKQADWTVINQDKIPAVLTEGGFMDSNIDYKYITSDAGQTAYARAIAEGLIEFLGLEKKTTTPSTPSSGSTDIPFLIKVANVASNDVLNIRKEPDADAAKTGELKHNDPNAYTIIEVRNGWGKLKSGIGWINLHYTNTVSGAATPVVPKKSVDEWAREVIAGKHGKGHANRKASLKASGCQYDYDVIRKRVNELA